ncbi:MAG TPA: N-acetyltransferase [Candidatus Limnocylindrales bacterium]|nr:N-acetyltransferase [Candidatus Limnocylindrales bacterium]
MTLVTTPDLIDAPSWSIRPELPVDLDQIHELHREAFRGPTEAELVDAVRAGADFIPELSLVAVAGDGSVLGHIMVSRVGFEPDAGEAPRVGALAIAPLAVLPPHQGRGIGAALMGTALATADQRDEALIAVLGAPSFYARFGFGPAADLGVRSPYDEAGDAYQVRPVGGRAVEPGSVVYPAMFEAGSRSGT